MSLLLDLKRFPGVRDTIEKIIIYEVKQSLKRWIKCICIVNNRFWLYFDRLLLKRLQQLSEVWKKPVNSNKKTCRCPGHRHFAFHWCPRHRHFIGISPVSRTPANFSTVLLNNPWIVGVRDTGNSHFTGVTGTITLPFPRRRGNVL